MVMVVVDRIEDPSHPLIRRTFFFSYYLYNIVFYPAHSMNVSVLQFSNSSFGFVLNYYLYFLIEHFCIFIAHCTLFTFFLPHARASTERFFALYSMLSLSLFASLRCCAREHLIFFFSSQFSSLLLIWVRGAAALFLFVLLENGPVPTLLKDKLNRNLSMSAEHSKALYVWCLLLLGWWWWCWCDCDGDDMDDKIDDDNNK